jgi:YidC/Oxa1 family membrane protein insertase
MWLQFRLNPAPMDPVQKQVFAFMPWVLMFVMAPFAAGLQLYWTVNNLISIGQQKLLYARHPALSAQASAAAAKPEPAAAAEPDPPPADPPARKAKAKPRPRAR